MSLWRRLTSLHTLLFDSPRASWRPELDVCCLLAWAGEGEDGRAGQLRKIARSQRADKPYLLPSCSNYVQKCVLWKQMSHAWGLRHHCSACIRKHALSAQVIKECGLIAASATRSLWSASRQGILTASWKQDRMEGMLQQADETNGLFSKTNLARTCTYTRNQANKAGKISETKRKQMRSDNNPIHYPRKKCRSWSLTFGARKMIRCILTHTGTKANHGTQNGRHDIIYSRSLRSSGTPGRINKCMQDNDAHKNRSHDKLSSRTSRRLGTLTNTGTEANHTVQNGRHDIICLWRARWCLQDEGNKPVCKMLQSLYA